MQAITRKQAVEAGEKTYYTGVPCRNGHTAVRYTVSGSCKDCIAEAVAGVRRAVRGVGPTPERVAQLEGLVAIRLRVVPVDAQTLLGTVAAMTLARRPLLVATDVVGARNGTKPEGGTLLYIVNVDEADVPLIRGMASAMLQARGPNVEAIRARAFGIAAQAEAARDNGETEWNFK